MPRRFQVFIVALSTGFLGLLLLGSLLARTSAAQGDAYRHFAVFTDVVSRIKSDYVEEPDMKSVTLGAVNGLLESIDPFASFLSADQYKQYLKSRETPRASVGLVLARRFGYISVVDSVPGSPAAVLGLGTGDVIETIGGVSTRDMPLAYAELLLEGEPGTNVELTVLRARRGPEAQKIGLVRQMIADPPVTAKMVTGEVGYIQVQSLAAGKAAEIAAKVRDVTRQGAKHLVLDLRNAAQGDPTEAAAAANLFLDQGLITYSQGQRNPRRDFSASADKAITKLPLVVITNRATTGAAEVLAAALLENKRAEVVGERTYGDAAQRKALTLEDGSAVILAVARYHSPAGKAISETAVTPTLQVADSEPPVESEEEQTAPAVEPKPAEDLPLKKAIEVVTLGIEAARRNEPKQAARKEALPSPDGRDLPPLQVPRAPR